MNEDNQTGLQEFCEGNISMTGAVSGRNDFIGTSTLVSVSTLLVLTLATIVGTCGNLLILISVATTKKLRQVETVFIVNLAISDLYVTSIADPMSIVAKIEGEAFFDQYPGLCRTIASVCTIACVTSLLTIGVMSINRYIFICAREKYERIFSKWNSVCICLTLYIIGGILVLLNTANIGDHGFDRKSLECIWDRMATFSFTVVFSVVLVWIPSVVTGVCYLMIYLHVRSCRRRVKAQQHTANRNTLHTSFHLAKPLFIIYAVFVTCWAPYALLIVIDSEDTFSHEVHIYITMFSHLHPSVNWFIYYVTNKNFNKAYKQLLCQCTRVPNTASIQSVTPKHLTPRSSRVNVETRHGGSVNRDDMTVGNSAHNNVENGYMKAQGNVTETMC